MGNIERDYRKAKVLRSRWTLFITLASLITYTVIAADAVGGIVLAALVGSTVWACMSYNVDRAAKLLYLGGKRNG